MKILKKTLISALYSLCTLCVFGASFSGNAGLKGELKSSADSGTFDTIMTLTGFFEGQFNINNNLFFKTEMSITTDDVIETKLTEKTNASFCFDELSLTYVKPFLGLTQFFSLYKGTFQAIGTNQFLSQQFGISSITSSLTENYLGNKCASPYSVYGLGLSYVAKLNHSPLAFGGYVYKNNENEANENQINIDLRFAGALKSMTFDLITGLGAPAKNKNGDEDVIVLIDELYLHTGIDFLLGNRYSNSLFVQFGFNSLGLKKGDSNSSFSSEDLYLIFEPRFHLANSQIHLSFFNFPENQESRLEFIEGNMGVNLNIFADKLFIRNVDFMFGFNTSFSYDDHFLGELKEIKDFYSSGYIVKISPYLSFPVMSGTFKMMLQAKLSESSQEKWPQKFKLNLGYKSYF